MDILGITITEWVGYIASLLLIISFLQKNVRTLRIINSFGCFAFIIYGFLLESIAWPVVITNGFIVLFNVYYLFLDKEKS